MGWRRTGAMQGLLALLIYKFSAAAEVLLANPGFESGSDYSAESTGWSTACLKTGERVRGGGDKGGPRKPRSGRWMYRARAERKGDQGDCSRGGALSQTISGLKPETPYHVMVYVWLPVSACTKGRNAAKCPELVFDRLRSDGSRQWNGAGTTVTAIANQWNLISGSIWSSGSQAKFALANLPRDVDVWIDDFYIADCSIEKFRSYTDKRIRELRQRSVTINFGPPVKQKNAATASVRRRLPVADSDPPRSSVADADARRRAAAAKKKVRVPKINVVMERHLYPWGAAMFSDCADDERCLAFFKAHFNWAVLENGMKWAYEEPRDGIYSGSADVMVDHIESMGLQLRGHSVFWEREGQIQDWVRTLPRHGGEGSLQQAMWQRLRYVVNKYKNKVANFDVNNEMLHGWFYAQSLDCNADVRAERGAAASPCICDYAAACPRELGLPKNVDVHTWMYKAMSHYIPGVRMFTNDYCMLMDCETKTALSKLVDINREIKEATGMGVQGHLGDGRSICGFNIMARFDYATAAINFMDPDSVSQRALLSAKKKMWVTELDIQDEDESRRADAYETMYRAAYASAGVEGLVTWGWSEASSWRPHQAIVDADFTLKLESAQRVFGADGLLHGAWNSTLRGAAPKRIAAAGVSSGSAAHPDAAAAASKQYHVTFKAFPGDYAVEVGGCVTRFSVPVGAGALAFDARHWSCKRGKKAPFAPPKSVGGAYDGCYAGTPASILAKSGAKFASDTMTPQLCVNKCKAAGKRFAALSRGRACTCGAAVRAARAPLPSGARCDAKCAGGSSSGSDGGAARCGGADAASVWSVAAATTV